MPSRLVSSRPRPTPNDEQCCPTTAVQCCLARPAKVAPEEFPFREIVPGRREGPGRQIVRRRGTTELHKFECGLQTRQRAPAAMAKPQDGWHGFSSVIAGL